MRNFFSGQLKGNQRVQFVALFVFIFTLASCSSLGLKTRDQTQNQERLWPSSSISSQSDSQKVPQKQVKSKLGLILGPGGVKTFAHAGVIKKIVQAKIPIDSIVGHEWGALVAALFAQAQSKRVHEVDWKLYKLEGEGLLKKSLFSKKWNSQSIAEFESFFTKNFTEKIENSSIRFACPVASLQRQTFAWMRQGSYASAVKKCMVYPPLLKPEGHWVAAPLALQESVNYLRKQGVDVIVYVDVLGRGKLFGNGEVDYATRILWKELQNSVSRFEDLNIERVRVGVDSIKMFDFSKRQSLVLAGEKSGERLVQKIIEKYNF